MLCADVISFLATSKCQKIQKTGKNSQTEEENWTFWMTRWISMKLFGKNVDNIKSLKNSGLSPL